MRFEWLFFRWLFIILIVGFGARYLWTERDRPRTSNYQRVVLLQSASSFGLPLAGIAVDPQTREVYGLLGRSGKEVPPDFFILWKDKSGENYGAVFSNDSNHVTGVCEILPGGEIRTLHDFRSTEVADAKLPEPAVALRSIVNALPPEGALPSQPKIVTH